MYFFEGLLYGLATLFIIGPVVFILINVTIENGTKWGYAVVLGISLSDLIYALISTTSLKTVLNNSFLNKYISLLGFFYINSVWCFLFVKKRSL